MIVRPLPIVAVAWLLTTFTPIAPARLIEPSEVLAEGALVPSVEPDEPEFAACVLALVIWLLTWPSTLLPDGLSDFCPPAEVAVAVTVTGLIELAMKLTAAPAVTDRPVDAVAVSPGTTFKAIAIPTALLPAALPLAEAMTTSVCVAVAASAPVITSGPDAVPSVAIVLLFTTATAAESRSRCRRRPSLH